MDLLQVKRRIFTDKSTIGDLYFDNDYFCATLEDPCRTTKINGITAIPPGRYKLDFRHSPKFKRVMPYLENVPNYSGVMIHWGNFATETDGCLLVGQHDPNTAADFISNSRKTFEQLMAKLLIQKDGDIYISITGGTSHSRRAA